MNKFAISTDSTCDLYSNEIKELDLYFLPLTFSLTDGGVITEHKDCFQSEREYNEYYDKLRSGIISKTSMNNPIIHEEYFRELAEKGLTEVIHFTISYGLGRTIELAREAVKVVQKDYPNFNCLCVECSTTTIGQGMLVKIAVDMRDKGKTLQETFDYVESIKRKIQHFVIVDDLKFLMRGGRISATSATVGTLLNVKPIIIFTKEGKLQKYKQTSGMRHAVKQIVSEFQKYSMNKEYPIIYVGHTGNDEMALYLKKSLLEQYKVDAEIRMIGPIIASHLGPNAVAYAFLSSEERPM